MWSSLTQRSDDYERKDGTTTRNAQKFEKMRGASNIIQDFKFLLETLSVAPWQDLFFGAGSASLLTCNIICCGWTWFASFIKDSKKYSVIGRFT